MAGSPLLVPNHQFFDDDGDPLAGGKLYSYLAGTTTPTPLYTTAALSVAHTNPIVLPSDGRVTAFMAALAYKLVLTDADDVVIWTIDNVNPPTITDDSLGFVFSFGGSPEVEIAAAAYPAGSGLDTLHAGTMVFGIDTADLPAGDYALEGLLVSVGGVTVSACLVNLSDGAPNTALTGSEITSTNTTGERKISTTITLPAGGTDKLLGVKAKVSSGRGFAYGFSLRKVG
jgi:hypothetical protein